MISDWAYIVWKMWLWVSRLASSSAYYRSVVSYFGREKAQVIDLDI
jgi:hypothetical protein